MLYASTTQRLLTQCSGQDNGCPKTDWLSIQMVIRLCENQRGQIKVNADMSDQFPITNGVEQICVLVPILNIFLCKDTQASNWFSDWRDGVFISYRLDYRVFCEQRLQANNMTQNRRIENLLLEDDAAHIAHSWSFAAHHMLLFRTLRSSVVSKSMSKALSFFSSLSTKGAPTTHVTIANVDLRSIQQFTYLGWIIAWMQNWQRNRQLSLRGI